MSARARVRREGDERLFMTLLGCTSKATEYEQKGRLGDMRRSSSSRRVSIVREIENVIYTAPRGRKVIYVAAVVVAAARPGGGGETLFFHHRVKRVCCYIVSELFFLQTSRT